MSAEQAPTDYVLEQIIEKSRAARDGHFNMLSKGEKLAAALVLNRPDWLADMDYTIVEAIERVGRSWMARMPEAARVLTEEAELAPEAASIERARKRDRDMDIGF